MAMEVSILDTGAHLSHLSFVVERRLSDLWTAGLIIERTSRDLHGVAIPQTRDYEGPSNGRLRYPDFYPPPDMQDVHISIGLDRGGYSPCVEHVLCFMNQDMPNKLGNYPPGGIVPRV